MRRAQQALEELQESGYEIDSARPLNGGINSFVFEIKANNGIKYALKLYRHSSKQDPRNRYETELNFLKYLHTCPTHRSPRIEQTSSNNKWILFEWIDGQKPKNLKANDLKEIADFIKAINYPGSDYEKSKLACASESVQSLSGLIKGIEKRISRLKSADTNSKTCQQAVDWLVNKVQPSFHSISQQLLEAKSNRDHWQNLNDCMIASPSDVGIHNTLRTPKGLYFIDYEYAGLDDLSKLVADWILQPECRLNPENEKLLINLILMKSKHQFGTNWVMRLNDIKPLIHIKWSLIMLNQLNKNPEKDISQLEKAMKYFQKEE